MPVCLRERERKAKKARKDANRVVSTRSILSCINFFLACVVLELVAGITRVELDLRILRGIHDTIAASNEAAMEVGRVFNHDESAGSKLD